MAIITIPTSTTVAFYDIDVTLDGVSFSLLFKFNQRDDTWYLSILDPSGTMLRAGMRVVNDTPLLSRWSDTALAPAGEIIPVTQGDVPQPATLNQLGIDVLLNYLDADEIAAALA